MSEPSEAAERKPRSFAGGAGSGAAARASSRATPPTRVAAPDASASCPVSAVPAQSLLSGPRRSPEPAG